MNEYAYMPDTKPFLGDTVCVTQKSFYIMKIKFWFIISNIFAQLMTCAYKFCCYF